MKVKIKATVLMAKCQSSKKGFGIRAEQRRSVWYFTWAFILSEKVAENERYNTTYVSGVINLELDYPGCPHCKASNFYHCGCCKGIVCYEDEKIVTCPHCNYSSGVVPVESFSPIKGDGF